MKPFVLFFAALMLSAVGLGVPLAAPPPSVDLQVTSSVSTLVPPTLVPTRDAGQFDTIPSESGVARILNSGVVRVGILYNEPPFGLLNLRGEVAGYDADLARSIAETWGVQVEFVQVTRQTGIAMVAAGEVDLLIAAQVHRRELDAVVEFSQTYTINTQSMMVREGDPAAALTDMANRRVGVVMGMPSEVALTAWQARAGVTVTVQSYLTLSQSVTALAAGEIDGVVDSRTHLLRAVSDPTTVSILNEAIAQEPYAIAIRRQDINLRNLVNRTLQYLYRSGRIYEIHNANIPEIPFSDDTIPVWANLPEDAPRPDQLPGDIPAPPPYVLPRIMGDRTLRVTGVLDSVSPETPEYMQRVDALNRQLVETLAARWGVTVQYVPTNGANPMDLITGGQADIAVGIQADWTWTDRIDFTSPYFLRGYRLAVRETSDIVDFSGLRGNQIVAIDINDPAAADIAVAEATEDNARIQIFQAVDAAYSILVDNNADAAFGDSVWLIPQLEANPGMLRITDEWYTHIFVGMAVPRNDIDFRLLVEHTIQDLVLDGTLATLLTPVTPAGDIPHFVVWPGVRG